MRDDVEAWQLFEACPQAIGIERRDRGLDVSVSAEDLCDILPGRREGETNPYAALEPGNHPEALSEVNSRDSAVGRGKVGRRVSGATRATGTNEAGQHTMMNRRPVEKPYRLASEFAGADGSGVDFWLESGGLNGGLKIGVT